MESGAISDAQISASSHYTKNLRRDYSAKKARLNSRQWRNRGCWAAATNDLHQWLQVDLGGYTKVTMVATQGSGYRCSKWRVTKFKIRYSSDGDIWQVYKEPGNSNAKVRWTC